ncbi:MAG TPA: deoxyhypusine synthase family protein, partial [Ktedonobacterales bacterium]|nr:deoxyhypusine synthase family protein [Ktedonobacterales bacterium]
SRCDTRKLADRILVEQVLNDYPAAIGMTKIGGPYMFEYQAPDPAYSGVSGLVVIAESHIAIHTFPELDYFTMDIFSCKNFDHEKAIEYIRTAFDVVEMDRMLVQRGLSFKGPHHGKNGATDELIAAAEARLNAGIISKEPALPDETPSERPAESLSDERAAVLARHAAAGLDAAGGRMLWPQYGVTPDVGTYGAGNATDDACEPCARGGATVVALTGDQQAPTDANGTPLPASEPVLVNPTASMSGLLDKMAATGGQARALGLALAEWERLVRAEKTAIALTLSAPVIAEGMRELLVYAVERGYVDSIIASSENLFADLYEALGHAHFVGDDGAMVMTVEGRERALAFFRDFLAEQQPGMAASDLWQRLGASLPTKAPRKGLLQAAAQTGTPIYTPDLGVGAFGAALLTSRPDGASFTVDSGADTLALARLLAARAAFGVIQCGAGASDALLAQAQAATGLLGLPTPALVGVVALGAQPFATGRHAIAVRADASLALPLLVSGLAQRHPQTRTRATSSEKAPALA